MSPVERLLSIPRLVTIPLLWVSAGIMLGLIVHIVTVFALPPLATRDARARLAPVAELHRMVLITGPGTTALPGADPAFEAAVCRFDLAAGALRVRVPATPHYTVVTLYSADGVALAAINDRVATRRFIDLYVMTTRQRAEAPVTDDDTRLDSLFLTSAVTEGFIMVRALAVQPSLAPVIRELLARDARCSSVPVDQVGQG